MQPDFPDTFRWFSSEEVCQGVKCKVTPSPVGFHAHAVAVTVVQVGTRGLFTGREQPTFLAYTVTWKGRAVQTTGQDESKYELPYA